MNLRLFIHPLIAAALCSCTITVRKPAAAPPSDVLPSLNTPQGAIGCQKMMDDYCAFLYSPDALGNLEVTRPMGSIKILQGETENDFTQVYYRYARTKLNHREALPPDLLQALAPYGYFDQLRSSLQRKPRRAMTLAERLEAERLDAVLDSEWTAAINEAVLLRLDKRFPGVHQLSDREMPPEYEIESKKIRRILISEVSKALWRDDANWKKVEDTFEKLKGIFADLIAQLDIDVRTRTSWIDRIHSVKLALPGSLPEISDEECSTTTANAYYYKYLDVITVCAGDFNSEDILLTLSHEMAHSLDISHSQYIYKINSELGLAQRELRGRVCLNEPVFSCEKWTEFKTNFDRRLAALGDYRPDVPAFNRCLKRKPTPKTPTDEDYSRIAHTITLNRYSSLASNGYFLRITKKKMPLRNGHLNLNPYYLDPCRYYLWSRGEEPPEEEVSSLVYFTAEFRCADPDDPERFRHAIEVSKNMTEKMLDSMIKLEGEFSAWEAMEREGFASPPFERFADVVGSYAMAEFLRVFPHITDRRAKFLASSSWQCSEPGLNAKFPDESKVESEYSFSHHSEGIERRREILSQPVREALTCEKDFEFSECQLPIRSPAAVSGKP